MIIVLNKINRLSLIRSSLGLVLFALLAIIVSGCGNEKPKKPDTGKRVEYSEKDVSLTVDVDKTTLLLAQDIGVKLTASAPEGWTITFPEFSKKFGELDIIDEVDSKELLGVKKNEVEKVVEIKLSSQLAGKYALPEFTVKFKSPAAKLEHSITTKPIDIVVSTLLGNDTKPELKDIGDVWSLEKDYFVWYLTGSLLILIILVVAVLAVIKYLHRLARLRALSKPFFTALKELDLLEKSGSIENGMDDLVYTKMSDILRYYIEARFGIVASKSTTEEFLAKISDDKLLISSYSELLKVFLQKCDIVKFAKYDASEKECRDVLKSCRYFILETKREEIRYHGEFGVVDE